MNNIEFQIPRNIYTSVPNLHKIDKRLSENWSFLKDNNPGWNHIVFDDDSLKDFIEDEYGKKFISTYQRIRTSYGAARADYFRYLLLLKKGGVWLDAKTTIDKPLDDILRPEDEFLLTQWTLDQTSEANELFWGPRSKIPVSEFLTWCIFTKPNHIFMQQVVEDVTKNINWLIKVSSVSPNKS
jgi:mannosyltransferase OCH1-like enzyme